MSYYFICFVFLTSIILSRQADGQDNSNTSNKCVLPPYPSHGSYSIGGQMLNLGIEIIDDDIVIPEPGDAYPSVLLNYTCDYGYYMPKEKSILYCLNGNWFGKYPECERYCRLSTHPSVEYECLIGPNGENGTRHCKLYEPLGTVVRPSCKKPKYYSRRPLPVMHCKEKGYTTYTICLPAPPSIMNNYSNDTKKEPCRIVSISSTSVSDSLWSNFSEDQWQCHDGSCIFSEAKCDLIDNCEDASDESFHVCNSDVDDSKVCILPDFPLHGTYTLKGNIKARPGHAYTKVALNYTCFEGYTLQSYKNEIICREGTWSDKFPKCADNNCVGDDCNENTITAPSGKCILPPYPMHGTYVVNNNLQAGPGQGFLTALLSYTCLNGYGFLNSTSQVFCYDGTWSSEFPTCVRLCRLDKHASVEYLCRVPEVDGYRECKMQEPVGTVVHPKCRAPHYYYSGVLSTMHCLEDGWDNYPVCLPECGRLTPGGMELIIDGREAQRGEIPWHAGIYRTKTNPYMQICGGSLVSTTVVISAAHCFWNDVEKKLPESRFAVAVGKLYSAWDHPNDTDAQKSEVKQLVIPSRFRGAATNFQDDIALVVVKTALTYEIYVRPVCMDFDRDLERRQLSVGRIGKVAGWGLTGANGNYAKYLQVIDIPYVDIDACISQVPHDFRELITSDKFCAGYMNGTALCQGDSGGGLAFPENDKAVERYFLRGIVSTAPRNNDKCTKFSITTFTQVTRHVDMIKEYL